MPGRARAHASTIGAIYDRISPAVEGAMIATCKTFGRSVPVPRRDPLACEDVTSEQADAVVIARSAHLTFLRLLAERSEEEAMAWRRHEPEDESVRTTARGPDYAVVQFFARRPSV